MATSNRVENSGDEPSSCKTAGGERGALPKPIKAKSNKPKVAVELESWEKPRKSLLDHHLERVSKDVPPRVGESAVDRD